MATPRNPKPAQDSGIGHTGVTSRWVIVISIVFAVASILLLYGAWVFWPPTLPPAVFGEPLLPAPDTVTTFLGLTFTMTREQNLLLLVAILGALGAMGHVLRSFFKYVGERNLIWSWVPSYFLIPLVGSILATITYILLRAGLIGASGAQEGNTWGFAAISTLVGLFTAQAAAKLKEVFEIVLAKAPAGSESVASREKAPTPLTFIPAKGSEGTRVEISGDGIEEATEVVFGGDVAALAEWDDDGKVLVTEVPAEAKSGVLKVAGEAGELATTAEFKVTGS